MSDASRDLVTSHHHWRQIRGKRPLKSNRLLNPEPVSRAEARRREEPRKHHSKRPRAAGMCERILGLEPRRGARSRRGGSDTILGLAPAKNQVKPITVLIV